MSSGLRQRRGGGGGGSDGGDDNGKRKTRVTLETFDLYTKVRDDEQQAPTTSGATVTLLSFVVCLVLIGYELHRYIVPRQKEHMAVDPVIEGRLRINFDVTFPALQCSEANLDAMDVAGEQQNGVDHDMVKMRLAPDGSRIGDAFAHVIGADGPSATPLPEGYCGSCFGAQSFDAQCCNTCDAVRDAYALRGWNSAAVAVSAEQCLRDKGSHGQRSEAGEGCRLTGYMLVNKVAGNFHIAMGETHSRGNGHIHQFNPSQLQNFNTSHVIHSLSFGEPFPGIRNPLDGTVAIADVSTGVFMYFAKIVPTIFTPANAPHIATNQYSVTSQFRPLMVNGMRQNVLPGIFVVYDISPFQVTVTTHTSTLTELVTSLCAILGGVITAAGLLDALLGQVQRQLGVKSLLSFLSLVGEGHGAASAKVVAGAGALGGAGASPPPPAPAHHAHGPAAGAGAMPTQGMMAGGMGGGRGSPTPGPPMHASPQQHFGGGGGGGHEGGGGGLSPRPGFSSPNGASPRPGPPLAAAPFGSPFSAGSPGASAYASSGGGTPF